MDNRKLYAILAGLVLLASMLARSTMDTAQHYADSFQTQAVWKCDTYQDCLVPPVTATPER